MTYASTSNSILFRPVIEIKIINDCRDVFDLNQMKWFQICQGMWGLGFLRNFICWERSYWFATPGGVWLASVYCWEKKSLTAHSKYLSQLLITTTPQVNQDKDQGGDFCHSKGRIYWQEDEVGKNQKDEEGSGWMYVSQNGVALSNNRGVHYLVCNFLETPFLCCCDHIFLQPEPTAYFFRVPYCFWNSTNIKPDNILQLVL